MKRKKRAPITPIIIVITAVLGGAFAFRHDIKDAVARAMRGPIPPAASYADVLARNANANANIAPAKPTNANLNAKPKGLPATNTASSLPEAANLAVAFILQAPYQNWDEIHEDACEEASAAMVNLFYKGVTGELTKEEMDKNILEAVAWENEHFGRNKDTSAEETARFMRELYGLKAKVVTVASMKEIKKMVVAGKPVIMPAYGRALKNPNFRNGGPLYHMLVIKGYRGTKIITNDPGTRRGADYLYDEALLWDALHDWNGGDVPRGPKNIIVVE
ncbi:C39 family peptidase [Candidatus Uhrbacteria bacterium]|nr:C39 family peptidase [Candidatus Uhrbacteria bacterium]